MEFANDSVNIKLVTPPAIEFENETSLLAILLLFNSFVVFLPSQCIASVSFHSLPQWQELSCFPR